MVVGRGEETYFAAPTQALLGGMSYWDDRPPKRGKAEGETVMCMPLGIERENAYTVGRKGCHSWPINQTAFSLSGVGEGDANEPVVVGRYTQTKKWWLKGKIVKSGHNRRYKKTSTVPRIGVEK